MQDISQFPSSFISIRWSLQSAARYVHSTRSLFYVCQIVFLLHHWLKPMIRLIKTSQAHPHLYCCTVTLNLHKSLLYVNVVQYIVWKFYHFTSFVAQQVLSISQSVWDMSLRNLYALLRFISPRLQDIIFSASLYNALQVLLKLLANVRYH